MTLPQNGHQAKIKVNLCYGYNTTNGTHSLIYKIQNYQLSINLYSSNGFVNPNSALLSIQPYVGSSRMVDPTSYIDGFIYNRTGIFHSGYVNCLSPVTTPLGVFMGLTSTPLTTVDIWIQSYAWHGLPLIQVSQTAGSFNRTFVQQNSMPNTGWIRLDMITSTPIFLYKNPSFA